MMDIKILRIGLTGGIGSGKSVVCRMFRMLGAACYDSDSQAKKLMTEDAALMLRIKEAFGDESYFPDGTLNRSFLASNVFGESESLARLNSLVHPAVMRDFDGWVEVYDRAARSGEYKCGYVLMESAIIFDNNLHKLFDCVVTVSAPKELRVARTAMRDGVDKGRVEARLSVQLSDCAREALADFTIINDGERLVWPQITTIHEMLSESYTGSRRVCSRD